MRELCEEKRLSKEVSLAEQREREREREREQESKEQRAARSRQDAPAGRATNHASWRWHMHPLVPVSRTLAPDGHSGKSEAAAAGSAGVASARPEARARTEHPPAAAPRSGAAVQAEVKHTVRMAMPP